MAHDLSSITGHPALTHFTKIAGVICDPTTDARTVAILGAAYLEKYLTEVISAYMPGLNSKLRDRIFKPPGGSLSDLGSKIDMARALGAADSEFREDCITVARIRNRFAHNIDLDSFDHAEIVELCNRFKFREHLWVQNAEETRKALVGTPRGQFVTKVLSLCSRLSNALNPNRAAAQAPSPAK